MQEPLVLIPGALCDARVFSAQATAFGTKTSVMVAPTTGGDRVEEIASRLLDHLPRRFALLGHAMGGMVAMELMRRAPDRVTRIALLNTNSLAETPQTAADYEPIIIKLKSGQIDEAVQSLYPTEALAPGQARARVQSLVLRMAQNVGPEAAIRQMRAIQKRRDYQAVLRRCAVPALVLCGAHDRVAPYKRHELMAGLIPSARLELIEEAGHLPMLETPNEVNHAIQGWLLQSV